MSRFLRRLLRRPAIPPETLALRDAVGEWHSDATPAAAEAMVHALRASTLFALLPADRPEGPDELLDGLRRRRALPVVGLDEVDGAPSWALFTDPRAGRAAFGERTRAVAVPALDALLWAAHHARTLLIDPREGAQPRLVIEAERAAPLAAGLIPDGRGGWRVGPDLRCRVDRPRPAPPDGLCAALGLIARREPGVETAHLLEIVVTEATRAPALALTVGSGVDPRGRTALVRRVEGHLDTLFRGRGGPSVFIADPALHGEVFARAVPLFVRDGLGGTGIEVPDGHRVGLVLPSARPELLALDCGTLLVDFGPSLDDFGDTLAEARTRLVRDPRPVVWVVQRTAVELLDAELEATLTAVFVALLSLGNPLIAQRAVVSAETSAGRALAGRIGALGIAVHALGPTREIAVEVTGPDRATLGLPGRHLAGP